MSEEGQRLRVRLGPIASGLVVGEDEGSPAAVLDRKITELIEQSQGAAEPAQSQPGIAEIRALLAQGFQEAERHHRGIIQMLILLAAQSPDEIQRGIERVESRVKLVVPQLEGADEGDYFDRLATRFQHFHETQIEPERDRSAGHER